jgi:hypothetical protein
VLLPLGTCQQFCTLSSTCQANFADIWISKHLWRTDIVMFCSIICVFGLNHIFTYDLLFHASSFFATNCVFRLCEHLRNNENQSYSQITNNEILDCEADFTGELVSILFTASHRFRLNSVVLSVTRPPFRLLERTEAAESCDMPAASIQVDACSTNFLVQEHNEVNDSRPTEGPYAGKPVFGLVSSRTRTYWTMRGLWRYRMGRAWVWNSTLKDSRRSFRSRGRVCGVRRFEVP